MSLNKSEQIKVVKDTIDDLRTKGYSTAADNLCNLLIRIEGEEDDSIRSGVNLPWFTAKDDEQIFEELKYLKNFNRENSIWRDLHWIEFKKEVLYKYKDNEFCVIGNGMLGEGFIAFLQIDKKTSASEVRFVIKRTYRNIIMIQAKQFIGVPPVERKHWEQFRIENS